MKQGYAEYHIAAAAGWLGTVSRSLPLNMGREWGPFPNQHGHARISLWPDGDYSMIRGEAFRRDGCETFEQDAVSR
jgi:hypothetical protein